MIPSLKSDRQHRQCGASLQAANGIPIPTYGTRSLTLNLGLRRPYRWVFIVADVKYPILGADFLGHHGLIIDVKTPDPYRLFYKSHGQYYIHTPEYTQSYHN